MYASLLVAAGKNVLYIARQLGHYAPSFTLDVYGHLLESVPMRQVEWIDEIVFPEGFAAALKLHLEGTPSSASEGHVVQPLESLEPLQDTAPSNLVQAGAAGYMVAAEGFEPPTPRV
jgi:hypothetical protein